MTAILFDLDGTLLDTAPDFAFVLNQLRAEKNLPALSLKEIRLLVAGGLNSIISIGLNCPIEMNNAEALSLRFLNLYRTCLGQHSCFFPEMPELLIHLDNAGIDWGIVTNKQSTYTLPLLQAHHLSDRTACVVSGDSTPTPKPNPAPLLLACKQMNITPEECFYIGDAACDIIAGKAAGMTTVAALFGYISNINEAYKWEADHYIQKPSEILKLLSL